MALGCCGTVRATTPDVPAAVPATPPPAASPVVTDWTLERCLNQAWENNHRRPASRFAVAAAEAQHQQALAGYWPQIGFKGAYQRMDQTPDFIFPASSFPVPAQSTTVPASVALITIPAGVLGPNAIQLPVSVPGQTVTTAAQQMSIPQQDIKLMDRNSLLGSIDATWLIFDGGMRRGYTEQAQAGLDAARAASRRTDLEVADSVRRLYWGAVLARQLHTLGTDTLARMEATLNLTETMYKEGSGKVKKTDFLDNKVMVETLRAMVALLEKNEAMAQAALANTMGLSWRESVVPADQEIAYRPLATNLDELVGTAYQFSPDWARLEAGLRAAAGAVTAAQSGYYPKIALTGEVHKWWNDYDAGVATTRNKEGWIGGVGIEFPLFEGFLTRHKVRAAQARAGELGEQKILLREGIGLQIKDTVLSLNAAQQAYQATLDAMKAAEENRDLNTRAYQNELVETEKVIRAQLVEALMKAQHYKTCYDHVALQSQLATVVGTEVWKQLEGK
ncbi:MAG TPA: TolC family protein [Opitutaceae bacterium]|nr:TolC family protein [Opitutaceae bacterium]